MPSSSAAFGLVAAVAFEGVVDGLHFQVAERDRARVMRPRRRRAARRSNRCGRCSRRDRAGCRRGSWRARSRWPARGRCPARRALAERRSRRRREQRVAGASAAAGSGASRCSASSGMSSIRSRSGGRWISNVLMRYIRSSRNSPAATISGRLRCVAQTTRTSTIERLVLADAADFAAFQHAQQLGLHRLGQLADFVEEDRAAVGHFEQADAVLVGAGERALAMAEQLAFDQRLGQRAAVDRRRTACRPAGSGRAASAPQAVTVIGQGFHQFRNQAHLPSRLGQWIGLQLPVEPVDDVRSPEPA